MGNVVSRDATALRTPPSTRCVPASSPRRDVGVFSCTDNSIASEQPKQRYAQALPNISAVNAKRDPSITDGSLKTSDRQTDLLGVGLLVLLLGRQRGNLDLDAQSLSS